MKADKQKSKCSKDSYKKIASSDKSEISKSTKQARQKSRKNAWGDEGDHNSFGLKKALKFILPRLWRGKCSKKALLIFNISLTFTSKVARVIDPIILMKVINSIICEEDSLGIDEKKCPTEEETYFLILFYCFVKLAYDFMHSFVEIPFVRMAAHAEISIANDVYYHIQSQSLAYHLSRETGKVIRIVSRGAQSFAQILRMTVKMMLGLAIEMTLTLLISLTLFSWQFTCI